MSRKEHHVVPSAKDGWDVKRNSSDRASVHTETKKEAVGRGRHKP
jgi:Uncharacterized protein conserved in bacteria (DUF2188)